MVNMRGLHLADMDCTAGRAAESVWSVWPGAPMAWQSVIQEQGFATFSADRFNDSLRRTQWKQSVKGPPARVRTVAGGAGSARRRRMRRLSCVYLAFTHRALFGKRNNQYQVQNVDKKPYGIAYGCTAWGSTRSTGDAPLDCGEPQTVPHSRCCTSASLGVARPTTVLCLQAGCCLDGVHG